MFDAALLRKSNDRVFWLRSADCHTNASLNLQRHTTYANLHIRRPTGRTILNIYVDRRRSQRQTLLAAPFGVESETYIFIDFRRTGYGIIQRLDTTSKGEEGREGISRRGGEKYLRVLPIYKCERETYGVFHIVEMRK